MKYPMLLGAFLIASIYSHSQFVYKIKADSVLITNDSCSAELILENSTKDIKGFLYNRGKGRTEFRAALTQINDTTYVIGDDTLRIFTGGVPANAWQLDGNTSTNPPTDFLGTTDATRLAIKTDDTERMTVLPNGRVLINTTTDQGNYILQAKGRIWSDKDALINDLTVGRGNGTSTPTSNSAFGITALGANTTGASNTAIGYLAMSTNTTASFNTALGASALQVNTTGNANTAIGAYSLFSNETGISNTSLGYASLYTNTTGSYNTGLGRSVLTYNTTGFSNTGIGAAALSLNTTGSNNTATGDQSLSLNTTGTSNTASGRNALAYNQTGSGNTAIGTDALKTDTTGSNNVAAGYLAGSNLTNGDNNIFIGYNTQPNISNTGSNQLNIGNWIYGNNGKIGINVASPTANAHLAGGSATANTAPLKFTSGTNLTTPENGAVEYDGTNYFVTSGSTRYTLAKTLSVTSALNFASTSAQSSSDMTVTVTGAADGDAVSLGVPNSAVSANTAYTAWVSAADTVTIRFNNYSSGSINPAAGTFRVSVIKY